MNFNDLKTFYGSIPAIVEGTKRTRATVYNWKAKGIPLEAQIDIESRTNGKLRAALPAVVRNS